MTRLNLSNFRLHTAVFARRLSCDVGALPRRRLHPAARRSPSRRRYRWYRRSRRAPAVSKWSKGRKASAGAPNSAGTSACMLIKVHVLALAQSRALDGASVCITDKPAPDLATPGSRRASARWPNRAEASQALRPPSPGIPHCRRQPADRVRRQNVPSCIRRASSPRSRGRRLAASS